MLGDFKVIVFDLDDTLCSWRDYAYSGYNAVSSWLQEHYNVEGFHLICQELLNTGNCQRILGTALSKVGIQSLLLEAQLVDIYREHNPDLELFPDAKSFLEVFSDTPKSLITDGLYSVQSRKVQSLGLEHVFDSIMYTDVIGAPKPSAEAFEMVMAQYKEYEPGAFVYIGDNPVKDFESPQKLGWQTVRMQRLGGMYAHLELDPSLAEGCLVLDSFDSLMPAVHV